MKTKNIIIGLALAGAGAYYAFKKGLFKKKTVVTDTDIKDAKLTTDVVNQLVAQENKAQESSVAIEYPKSDKAKIAKIQLALGIASDGVFGNQTLMAVRNKIVDLSKIYGGTPLGYTLSNLSLQEWQSSTNIDTLYRLFVNQKLITA
jgi:hypothetical protein